MRALTERSQGLPGKRQRLWVEIEPKQFTVWSAGLQNSASMAARADRAIHVPPRTGGTHRVYNLVVKNWLVLHVAQTFGLRNSKWNNLRYADLERSSVAKRWLLASVSLSWFIWLSHSAGVQTSK